MYRNMQKSSTVEPREAVRGPGSPGSPSQLLHFVDKSLKEDRASGEQVLKIRLGSLGIPRDPTAWDDEVNKPRRKNTKMAYMLDFIWVVYMAYTYIFSRNSMT